MKQMQILTGPINSGKTTRLENWVNTQSNIGGILCPVLEGKRYFYSIASRRYCQLESNEGSNNKVVSIGQFHFLKASFDWAIHEIGHSIRNKQKWIIIDEIGPLELTGQGFDSIIKKIMKKRFELKKTKFLFVVRNKLFEDFLSYYGLNKNEVGIVDFI